MWRDALPIVGTLLGFVVSFASTSWHNRAAFKREMATRWDARKIDAYIAYTTATKDTFRCLRTLHQLRSADAGQSALTPAEEDHATAERERSLTFEAVILLASETVSAQGKRVNTQLGLLRKFAEAPDESTTWSELEEALFDALNEFHAVAAAEVSTSVKRRTSAASTRSSSR